MSRYYRQVLRAYGFTDRGPVRPINEDCFRIDERLNLCIVADGMGGHNAGEVAARIAVDAITECVRGAAVDSAVAWPFGYTPSLSTEGNLLQTAVQMANVQVLEAATGVEAYAGMGTTIVAALLSGNRLAIAHVGDSRLYLYDRHGLRQVTADDSWVATVLASDPHADPSLFRHHPMRSAHTNVVGVRPGADVHVTEEVLSGGELVVLTTDGVHGVLDAGRMARALAGEGAADQLPERIVRLALAQGSRDNCTAVVAHFLPG
jgi:protein phosphatase